MAKVYGTFVFERIGDGCLTSKYCHRTSERPFSETCVSVEHHEHNNFEGQYRTVWLEESGNTMNSVDALLEIVPKPSGMFNVRWDIISGGRYEGIAMLYGDLLVGHYWSV
jgi:hypothetical protein